MIPYSYNELYTLINTANCKRDVNEVYDYISNHMKKYSVTEVKNLFMFCRVKILYVKG